MYDVIIAGAGPAGMTAAIYAGRAGYKTLLLEKSAPGGQASVTEIIENYPGFPKGIAGPELMMGFYEQAINLGTDYKTEEILHLDLDQEIKKVTTKENTYQAKAIIIASGARPLNLGVPGERSLIGKGVSYCATCDGFFFKNKNVTVVGGGDTAVGDALYLTKLCQKVTLIHRRDQLRATKILRDKIMQNEKVEIIWDSVVEEIKGQERVDSINIVNLKTDEKSSLATSAVFIGIGYIPNTDFLPAQLKKDAAGYLLTAANLSTNLSGVFAIGDVRQKALRQVTTAVGDGAEVVLSLGNYLESKEVKK